MSRARTLPAPTLSDLLIGSAQARTYPRAAELFLVPLRMSLRRSDLACMTLFYAMSDIPASLATDPPVAGKAWRGQAGGPFGQPHRPTRGSGFSPNPSTAVILGDFRRRTPGLPPFSSMNSTRPLGAAGFFFLIPGDARSLFRCVPFE